MENFVSGLSVCVIVLAVTFGVLLSNPRSTHTEGARLSLHWKHVSGERASVEIRAYAGEKGATQAGAYLVWNREVLSLSHVVFAGPFGFIEEQMDFSGSSYFVFAADPPAPDGTFQVATVVFEVAGSGLTNVGWIEGSEESPNGLFDSAGHAFEPLVLVPTREIEIDAN